MAKKKGLTKLTVKTEMDMSQPQKEMAKAGKSMDKIANNAERTNKNLKSAEGALERGGLNRGEHRGARSAAGNRGAAGRNFSGLAVAAGSDTGPIVSAYAVLAANVFALTSAFQALSEAARVDQIAKGMELLGARSGVALKVVSVNLQEITDYGLSAAQAMRAVTQASAGGVGAEEIERMGRVARGASVALGRDLGDSMDRLTRGIVKLEPELLDEIGIMVRIDEAVRDYAAANGVAASSLTLLQRRQAFANAVLEEGENKFGSITDQLDTNPYDKLSASIRDMTTESLRFINQALAPLASLLADIPQLGLLPLMFIFQSATSKFLPNFNTALAKTDQQLEVLGARFNTVQEGANSVSERLRGAYDDRNDNKLNRKQQKALSKLADRGDQIGASPAAAKANLEAVKVLIKDAQRDISAENKKIAAENNATTKQGLVESKAALQEYLRVLRLAKTELASLTAANQNLTTLKSQQNLNISRLNSLQATQEAAAASGNPLSGARVLIESSGIDEALSKTKSDFEKSNKTIQGGLSVLKGNFRAFASSMKTMAKGMAVLFNSALGWVGYIAIGLSAIPAIMYAMKSEAEKAAIQANKKLKEVVENAERTQEQMERMSSQVDIFSASRNSVQGLLDEVALVQKALDDLSPDKNKDFIVQKEVTQSTPSGSVLIPDPIRISEAVTAFELLSDRTNLNKEQAQALAQVYKRLDAVGAGEELKTYIQNLSIGVYRSEKSAQEIIDRFKELVELTGLTAFEAKDLAASFSEVSQEADKLIRSTEAKTFLSPMSERVDQALIELKRAKEFSGDSTKLFDQILKNNQEGIRVAANIAASSGGSAELQRLADTLNLAANMQKEAANATEQEAGDFNKNIEELLNFALENSDNIVEALENFQKTQQQLIENARQQEIVKIEQQATKEAERRLKIENDIAKKRSERTNLASLLGYGNSDEIIKSIETINDLESQRNQELIQNRDSAAEAIKLKIEELRLTKNVNLENSAYIQSQINAQKTLLSETNARFNAEISKNNQLISIEQQRISMLDRKEVKQQRFLKAQQEELSRDRELLSIAKEIDSINEEAASFKLDTRAASLGRDVLASEQRDLLRQELDNKLDILNIEESMLMTEHKLKLDNLKLERSVLTAQAQTMVDSLSDGSVRDSLQDYISNFESATQSMVDHFALVEDAQREVFASRKSNLKAQQAVASQSDLVFVEQGMLKAFNSAIEKSKLTELGRQLGLREGRGLEEFSTVVDGAGGLAELEALKTGPDPTAYDAAIVKAAEYAEQLAVTARAAENLVTVGDVVGSAFESALDSVIDGTKSLGQAFADMTIQILQDISKMIIKMLIYRAIQSTMQFIPGGPAISAFMGTAIPQATPLATGGIMAERQNFTPGVVTKPTFLVGEGKHNEAVVPLPNGRSIPVQMHGSTSNQQNNINVSINMETGQTSSQSSSGDMNELGKLVARAVQRELIEQKRPGNILSRYGAS